MDWQTYKFKIFKTSATNTVTHLPGPKTEVQEITNELHLLQLFSLFITDEMIDKIVRYTNQKIEKMKLGYNSVQWYISFTDAVEIKATIGLLYMSAI